MAPLKYTWIGIGEGHRNHLLYEFPKSMIIHLNPLREIHFREVRLVKAYEMHECQ